MYKIRLRALLCLLVLYYSRFVWVSGASWEDDKLNEVEVDGKGHVTKITSSADAHKPKAIGSESSLHPREANLAFIIHVSSGEMETFCRMFCRVWHPENFYVLNMNGMAAEAEHIKFNQTVTSWNLKNVLVMRPPHAAVKYGFSFVEVFLRGYTLALKYSQAWTHVVPLTALEYPLLNALDLRRVAGALGDSTVSIMDARPIPSALRSRMSMLCKDPAVHSSTGTLEAMAGSAFGVDRMPPSDRLKCRQKAHYMLMPHYPFYRGIWGGLLHRSAAAYIVEAPDGLPLRMQTAFAGSFLAEESYFQTVLCNSPLAGEDIVSLRQRYARWGGESFEPDVVTLERVAPILDLGFTFARRVSDADVMSAIDKSICGGSSDRVPATFTKGGCSLCYLLKDGSPRAPGKNFEVAVQRIQNAELANKGSCNPNITTVLLTDREDEELFLGADSAEVSLGTDDSANSTAQDTSDDGDDGAVNDDDDYEESNSNSSGSTQSSDAKAVANEAGAVADREQSSLADGTENSEESRLNELAQQEAWESARVTMTEAQGQQSASRSSMLAGSQLSPPWAPVESARAPYINNAAIRRPRRVMWKDDGMDSIDFLQVDPDTDPGRIPVPADAASAR